MRFDFDTRHKNINKAQRKKSFYTRQKAEEVKGLEPFRRALLELDLCPPIIREKDSDGVICCEWMDRNPAVEFHFFPDGGFSMTYCVSYKNISKTTFRSLLVFLKDEKGLKFDELEKGTKKLLEIITGAGK